MSSQNPAESRSEPEGRQLGNLTLTFHDRGIVMNPMKSKSVQERKETIFMALLDQIQSSNERNEMAVPTGYYQAMLKIMRSQLSLMGDMIRAYVTNNDRGFVRLGRVLHEATMAELNTGKTGPARAPRSAFHVLPAQGTEPIDVRRAAARERYRATWNPGGEEEQPGAS